MTLYWDIDGVLRNLVGVVFPYEPQEWAEKCNGRSLNQVIDDDTRLLRIAEPFQEYLDVANSFMHIDILSAQPKPWRTWTCHWLAAYVTADFDVKYVDKSRDKLNVLQPGDIIIDDGPFYDDFSQVALIDRAYNRHIDAPVRIASKDQLIEFLDGMELWEELI